MITRRLVVLTTLLCVCASSIAARGTAGSGAPAVAPMLDARLWIAALPRILVAPAVPAGWQIVSMVADDIDADGDLDVVASDGTLDLIVWINDGTGQLHRSGDRPPRAKSTMGSHSGTSWQPAGLQSIPYAPHAGPAQDPSSAAGMPGESRRLIGSPNALPPILNALLRPRGPPLS